MSQNIVEVKQRSNISKDNTTKGEMITGININNPKKSLSVKAIAFISLLVFLIISLFISCLYLFLSKEVKKPSLPIIISPNVDHVNQKQRRIEENTQISNIQKEKSELDLGVSSTLLDGKYINPKKNVLFVTNHFSKKKILVVSFPQMCYIIYYYK